MFTPTNNINFILLTVIFIAIIFITIIVIYIFIFFAVIMYLMFKLLNSININVLFYDYNKKTKRFLSIYGDNTITKLYLVRQPICNIVTCLFNIVTFYKYTTFISEAIPYHTQFILEIKQNKNMSKLLLLEKNNCINITDKFYISNCQDIKNINIKKRYSVNSILKNTQDRIGTQQYFNWNLYDNNCQEFTKEFLVTINKYNKTTHDFMFNKSTDLSLHSLISICNIYNIFEKYIYDNLFSN